MFTPLSKFFLLCSYIKGPKEKYLNIHIIAPEIFLALPRQAPCFRRQVLLKEEQSLGVGTHLAEMEMAGFSKNSARAMRCMEAPVEGVWMAAGAPRAGRAIPPPAAGHREASAMGALT